MPDHRPALPQRLARALLTDFPEDVLLNLGIAPGSAGTLYPAAFGLEPQPLATESAWPTYPETQQTDPSQPGPDDVVNG